MIIQIKSNLISVNTFTQNDTNEAKNLIGGSDDILESVHLTNNPDSIREDEKMDDLDYEEVRTFDHYDATFCLQPP